MGTGAFQVDPKPKGGGIHESIETCLYGLGMKRDFLHFIRLPHPIRGPDSNQIWQSTTEDFCSWTQLKGY